MHRIRAGVTGLGLVFLVTLLGSIALAPSGRNAAPEGQGEPLAQLGVAPSAGERAAGAAGLPLPAAPAPPAEEPPAAAAQAERPVAGRQGVTGHPDQVVI